MSQVSLTLTRYEGSLNKCLFDDKGFTCIAAWGLPPYAHLDDPARGLLAAVEAHALLQLLGLDSHFGVTTGTLYCGPIGSAARREYTVIGSSVNLAARLMAADKKHLVDGDGGVLCDLTTARQCAGIRFRALPPVELKGIARPCPVFRPVDPHGQSGVLAAPLYPPATTGSSGCI